jgi:hypothetical protein
MAAELDWPPAAISRVFYWEGQILAGEEAGFTPPSAQSVAGERLVAGRAARSAESSPPIEELL